jgi:hypothetical protein
MKKFSLIALIVAFTAMFCMVVSAQAPNSLDLPTSEPTTIQKIIVGVLSIYEIIVRIVPTVGSLSVIKLGINFLSWLSDKLDRTKKASK